MRVRILSIILITLTALTACTTAEKTATGAGVGAVIGGVATRSAGGAVAGALIGGFGTYLFQTADGRCRYRNSKGQVYTTKCHWKK